MISTERFFEFLKSQGIKFFSGVPDSLLKDFCAFVQDNTEAKTHVLAANEGNAIALAAGFHLASQKYGLVYMQNSGLGNAINPLVSLADPAVYSIPMLLMIGWRGEDGLKDEPQHEKQGSITLPLLKTLGIAHYILPKEENEAQKTVKEACEEMKRAQAPVALVVRKGSFAPYQKKELPEEELPLSREEALRSVIESLEEDAIVVSTTGKLSRELFELRKSHERDFLMVGSMGHVSSLALGIALREKSRPVYCLDGDGAALMHLGSWPVIGQKAAKNFKHILFNNGAHDSVGGQGTAAKNTDFLKLAEASGYHENIQAQDEAGLKAALEKIKESAGPTLLEILVHKGARKDLGRPTRSPQENKEDFMKFIHG